MTGTEATGGAMRAGVSDRPPKKNMVFVPGGTFLMGSSFGDFPEEGPVRSVSVDGFWIDETPVTVGQFRRFVKATGYVTVAEREWDLGAYGAEAAERPPPEPGSLVFVPARGRGLGDLRAWWHYVPGASWLHPEGPETTTAGREYHPVVHVAWDDVAAYAQWAGKAPPTEAEWEFAARGGLDGATYPWGDEFAPKGREMANVWVGEFPWRNLKPPRLQRTSPVRSFAPNGYGLYDVVGNVWEWTSDFYRPSHLGEHDHPCCTLDNPLVDSATGSFDDAPGSVEVARRVIKGGSHLCSLEYCQRYRPAARQPQMVDTSMSHVGFRCIIRE